MDVNLLIFRLGTKGISFFTNFTYLMQRQEWVFITVDGETIIVNVALLFLCYAMIKPIFKDEYGKDITITDIGTRVKPKHHF